MTSYMESLLQQPASSDHENPDKQEITSVDDNHSTNNDAKVDTSRAFRSVKEAVAIFDERLLAGVFFSSSPKPQTVSTSFKNQERKPCKASILPSSPPSPPLPPQLPLVLTTSSNISPTEQKPKEDGNSTVKNMLRKLEIELEETKRELSLLKERESETEIALATLNAELHKNMTKMGEAEAVAAGEKAALGSKRSTQLYIGGGGGDHKYVGSSHEDDIREEITKMERYSTSLAEVLSLGEKEGYFDHFQDKKTLKKNKMASIKKEKPIIPLVGDFFSRKKKNSSKRLNKL
ncbi:uncharacterized protein LOC113304612 [Papaver somniferum]|uniref:uncharacterized protein LOC113304612 n=1 Tax=Papaver somniferum TaxID=3469 RepID=UPI000E7050A8|nr:uncharacterized protein LOC113304612 [Papaver somniferum]